MGVIRLRQPHLNGVVSERRLAPFEARRSAEAGPRIDDRPVEIAEMDRNITRAQNSLDQARRFLKEGRISEAEDANLGVKKPVEKVMDIAWDLPKQVLATKKSEDMLIDRIFKANDIQSQSSRLSSEIKTAGLVPIVRSA